MFIATVDQCQLMAYNSHPAIPAPMAV